MRAGRTGEGTGWERDSFFKQRPIYSRAHCYFAAVSLWEQEGQSELLGCAIEGDELLLAYFAVHYLRVFFYLSFCYLQ